MELPSYEKLGSFYLGKQYDLHNRKLKDEKVLYDAKDLTTHAMCVGMTGSGKTGLCLALLEEAAIDGIPAIAIDPKGDLGNLLLAFPNLAPSDFLPWLEQSEAARQGLELGQLAEKTANMWREGLQQWEQDADRIARYRQAVDINIYTPGSNAGIPMTILRSFDAPPRAVIDDVDVMRERVSGAASGLLTLMGLDADPLASREHILLANIFDSVWRSGQHLDLGMLIRLIQSPPMTKVGVLDLESFYPQEERAKLAMKLNNLLASPSFSGWLEGQPLDIRQLLFTGEGKPRLSIISIAHLSDSERMFFVTILLNELLGWIRTQPGTSSLRALFYMDEVYGYFPPSAKPASKPPMMVLLKQARAFGLGIVLATQNPVDLDYKGLANIGTWLLGRLQTQRDKDRVLDGLEGAALQAGAKFDRQQMEQTLSALGSRVFLMHNVHDDGPTIFQSRWAMSFLRGPLSRPQIQLLMDERKSQLGNQQTTATGPQATELVRTPVAAKNSADASRPIVPKGITELFVVPPRSAEPSSRIYTPALFAKAACHYVKAALRIDLWTDLTFIASIGEAVSSTVWNDARKVDRDSLHLVDTPEPEIPFADLPADLIQPRNYKSWEKDLVDQLYRHEPLQLFSCKELNAISQPGQDELEARMAWRQQVYEKRDEEKAKLREQYAERQQKLETKIAAAMRKAEAEQAAYQKEKYETLLNFGTSVLGALLGKKLVTRTNVSRTSTAARRAGRTVQQRTEANLAAESVEQLEQEKRDLIEQLESEIDALHSRYSIEGLAIEPFTIPCRKGDIRVDQLALLWIPTDLNSAGIARSVKVK